MNEQGSAGSLVFRRSLESGKIWVRTECLPGSITVLQDENGADLLSYEAFFYGKPSQERIVIEFDQKPAELERVYLIGFGDNLPADKTIKEYLSSLNVPEKEIAKLIEFYELEKVHYLPCAHLPQVPQRIVQILIALHSEHPALVLKDPFMPFSGRWREHFAKLLHQNALERNRVIVCTNLSFVPQTWAQPNLMQYLDVGHAAAEARAKYRWEVERKERELQQEKLKKAVEQTVVTETPPAKAAEQPKPENKESAVLPESLQYVYKEAYDRIFTPLKELSDFLRSYAALVIVGCFTILIATMGIVFSPNLSLYQEKLKMLSKEVNFSFLTGTSSEQQNINDQLKESQKIDSKTEQTASLITHNNSQEQQDVALMSLELPQYELILPEEKIELENNNISIDDLLIYVTQQNNLRFVSCQPMMLNDCSENPEQVTEETRL